MVVLEDHLVPKPHRWIFPFMGSSLNKEEWAELFPNQEFDPSAMFDFRYDPSLTDPDKFVDQKERATERATREGYCHFYTSKGDYVGSVFKRFR